MISEVARAAAVLPVAIAVPLAIPHLRATVWRHVLTVALSLYAVAPLLPGWKAVVLVAGAPLTPLALAPVAPKVTMPSRRQVLSCLIAAASLVGAPLLLDADAARHAACVVIDDNAVAVTAAGALTAVFIGGAVVGLILRPFTAALQSSGTSGIPSLDNAGTYIGWFERALFFAFVVAGQPEAAAVALAAKSFARFPTLSEHREGFAEYFLIGTLASVTFATAVAVASRAALGLPAL